MLFDHDYNFSSFIADCTAPFSISGSSCFYVLTTAMSWHNARAECLNLGADLAMIKTASKQQEMKDYLNNIGHSKSQFSDSNLFSCFSGVKLRP